MRALVTGSGGQLGREFSRRLAEDCTEHLALSHEKLDISDLPKVREAVSGYKPDYIFNCAAYNAVDKAEEDWRSAFLANGIAVKNLLLASEESGSTLVHYSSDYVFDGAKGAPYTIADRPNPINSYGLSKLLGEDSVFRAGYPRYYLIRASWVFGEGESSFVGKLLGWMRSRRSLRIVDDQVSSPTYTEDLVRGTLELIKTESYGLYHMSNSGQCSRYDWAKFVVEAMNWGGELVPAKSSDYPSPAQRPAYSVLDNFPIGETIGFLLPDWREATERFLKRQGPIR
ncbi:MAG: dTDP-4-dehydrorhamnose reductase [Nitrospirota bacterium]|jgi:dTDP-4-dehydrorhamnose reductase